MYQNETHGPATFPENNSENYLQSRKNCLYLHIIN